MQEAGVGMSRGEEEKHLLGIYVRGSWPWVREQRGEGARGRGHVSQRGPGG